MRTPCRRCPSPPADQNDITVLRHVRPYVEIKAAEEIANRTPCTDFDHFKPSFKEAGTGLKTGAWMTKPFVKNASIELGDFFIMGGQIAYVAEMYEGEDGRDNPRRLIATVSIIKKQTRCTQTGPCHQ